jgi:UPF0755 protein
MKKKKLLTILIVLFLLIVIPAITFFFLKSSYEKSLNESHSNSTEVVQFEILPGESVDTIIPNLIEQDLLRQEYKNYFFFYLKTNKLIPAIQAGIFNIPKNLNIKELAETLQRAAKPGQWVTIPEGLRLDEVSILLSENLKNVNNEDFLTLASNQNFIKSLNLNIDEIYTLEGFLAPDKYLFDEEINTEEVIVLLVENFKNKMKYEYSYEDIILASLIEREGINSTDRRIISGILQKRLEEQWLLQVDATLLYHRKDWQHVITVQDIEEDHSYNTYRYYGLPPTPICNPGFDAVNAVFEPSETSYYYYIHYKEDNEIKPGYSRTLSEHETKVQQYLR